MILTLYAPANSGSLQSYTGGLICTGAEDIVPLCGGVGSNFVFLAGLPDPNAIDDVFVGSVTESGPAQVPEPSVLAFLGTGAAMLFLGRRRRLAVFFGGRIAAA